MKLAKYLLLVLFISIAHIVFSQEPPFWNDIQSFKKQDSVHMPPQHEILFVGSSSFTKWTDVQNYFPDHPIINRGFGGSTLLDVMMYAGDVITLMGVLIFFLALANVLITKKVKKQIEQAMQEIIEV